MDTYNTFKNELLQISRDLSSLFPIVKSIPEMYNHSLGEWERMCKDIQKQMADESVRVAVVGAIKSGKSTFVNSLFEGDYLKRGAGVVTSIVTRIRRSKTLKATLYFKSWNAVNTEMQQAMTLFPTSENHLFQDEPFDIRQEAHRNALQQAIDALNTDLLITHDTRNMNSVLLSSYLKGYETVKDILSDQDAGHRAQDETLSTQHSALSTQHCYKAAQFGKHKDFVGNDILSVYLKDIQLEIDSGSIDSNIEIADCQGSDSPNPLHLAMIQDYLLLTHLIIYVVSSRTGLRQADIRFLSIIKKMGIIDNILFIINTDFGEHESSDDLNPLIERIREELSLIKPDPDVYSLSALFNLFKAQYENLSDKDRMRFDQWQNEKTLADFSDQETRRFHLAFERKVKGERYFLLLKNHLERLAVILSGIARWTSINKDMLVRDAYSVNAIIEELKHHQKKMDKVKSMIKSTFDGAVQKVKQEIRTDVDRFFDARYGETLKNITDFIKNYTIPYEKYRENRKDSNFSNSLYLVFQEFKQALDMFMAETINPEIIRFVRDEEKKIKEHLEDIARPYDAMVRDALNEYNKTMENYGIMTLQGDRQPLELPDINTIKETAGLTLPPAAASMSYDAKIKTEAVLRLSIYKSLKFIKKMFRRRLRHEKEDHIAALKDSVTRMKRETGKSVLFHFKDYRENMKFQYIFKLVDVMAGVLYDILLQRFQTYVSDLSTITEHIGKKQIDKEQVSGMLKKMELNIKEIDYRINRVRENIGK